MEVPDPQPKAGPCSLKMKAKALIERSSKTWQSFIFSNTKSETAWNKTRNQRLAQGWLNAASKWRQKHSFLSASESEKQNIIEIVIFIFFHTKSDTAGNIARNPMSAPMQLQNEGKGTHSFLPVKVIKDVTNRKLFNKLLYWKIPKKVPYFVEECYNF